MSQWMIRGDQLDNEQNYFVFHESKKQGNKWLKGFPGTGKSVLLIHLILEKIEDNPNVFIAVVVFTNTLRDMFIAAMKESKIPYHNVYLTTYHQFIKNNFSYEYIFCDEVQDLPPSVLNNMKRRSRQLIVAGDENQSIYIDDPETHEKVVDPRILNSILETKPFELERIYRLTEEIIKSVDILKPEMNIGSAINERKKTTQIRLIKGEDEKQEVEYILKEAFFATEMGESLTILLPSHQDIYDFFKIIFSLQEKAIKPFTYTYYSYNKKKYRIKDYDAINYYMQKTNMNLEYLGNRHGDLYNANKCGKIIIMTYHSSKGLDFDNVLLPFQSRYFKNLYFPNDYDNSAKKTLLMVGMTRTKRQLYLTYSGNLPNDIKEFSHLCKEIEIDELEMINNKNEDEFEFDF